MESLRNLPTMQPEAFAGLIDIQLGRVVSMNLSRSEHCQMTIFAFGAGERVSEECVENRVHIGEALQNAADGREGSLIQLFP